MKQFFSAITICLLFALKAYSFTQIVNVENHVFTPSSFTINIGDTVKWTWVGGTHTTTSTTIPAGAAAWDHNINSAVANRTFIYVPTKAGLYNYKCTFHEAMGMIGNFTVVCPDATAQISASSATTFCKGGSVLLTSNVSAKITSYQWKNNGTAISGATNATYNAKKSGSYTLTVTNNCGNTVTSNTIKVTVNKPPTATITPSGTVNICSGDSIKLQANTGNGLTYQWFRGTTTIAGATKSSYTAKKAGDYKVQVTKTATRCKKTSAVTTVAITCLNGVAVNKIEKSIKIFPNPSTSSFHVSIPSYNSGQYSISVFDASATLIAGSKITSTDFSFGGELKAGVYLVQIKKDDIMIYEEKIIKDK